SGPGDVGSRPVHGLEDGRAGAGRVQVGRRGATDPARHRAGEVGEDVAEEIVGDDHVVPAGILHEVDAGGGDVVVTGPHVRMLAGDVVERTPPEVAGER